MIESEETEGQQRIVSIYQVYVSSPAVSSWVLVLVLVGVLTVWNSMIFHPIKIWN